MAKDKHDLLLDLAQLVRKYEPEEFARLSQLVRSGEFTAAVAQLLDSLSDASKRLRAEAPTRPSKRASKDDVEESLERMRESEPERYRLIRTIRQALKEKRKAPRPEEIHAIARSFSVTLPTGDRRVIMDELSRHLLTAPLEVVRGILDAFPSAKSSGSTLSGWADVIMPNRQTPPSGSAAPQP